MNVALLPAHKPTRLIANLQGDPRVPTNVRTTDATSALTRGIAEYVWSVQQQSQGQYQFVASFDAWAEAEDIREDYPAFVAYTNDNEGNYDPANLSQRVTGVRFADGTYEVGSASLDIMVNCEIWATDPEMRKAMVLQLEEAFNPGEIYGFHLELPHYFNQRASFALLKTTYLGRAPEAMQRFVNARMILAASVPVTRVLGFAELQTVRSILDVSNET